MIRSYKQVAVVAEPFGIALPGLLSAFVRFKLAKIDMTLFEFARRLIRGRGDKKISPGEFDDMRRLGREAPVIVHLRDRKAAQARPLPNAISSPFDEFLKDVVVEGRYSPANPIVLVCDTGQMSRVAANILVEDEAFKDVYNLNGGTARWEKWQLGTSRESGCCAFEKLVSCCT